MSSKALIIYSSKTGNTRRVAEALHAAFPDRFDILSIDDSPETIETEELILGFWVDKGEADKKTLTLLNRLEGRKIAFLGTLGAAPESDHARKVIESMKKAAEKNNEFLGCFLCRGKIDPKLTKMFEKMPANHPHAMDEARRQRHEEAAKHPNEEDFSNARAFFSSIFI